ncbi:MAG: pyridoxamine 5'-phosphate oxidase family protein [Deltaproteobacteria bacterium]
MAHPIPAVTTPPTALAALAKLLAEQKTMKLATAGGPVSPWVTGTYFVERDPFTLYLTLETRGKGMANIAASPHVAVAVDSNSPFTTFAQGEGRATVIEQSGESRHLAALRAKVPEIDPLLRGEIQLIEIAIGRWFVTSFPEGWFPAKVLTPDMGTRGV